MEPGPIVAWAFPGVLVFVVHPASADQAVRRASPLQIVAMIPARFSSSRFPGKPLADIDGRPMIEHVYRRAVACPAVSRVIVATDDARIADAVGRFGGEVRLTRRDHRSGTDRLGEVAATLDCDVIVNVQGDEPLIDPAAIAAAVAPFAEDPSLSMTTLYRRLDDPAEFADANVVKIVIDRSGFALYFSRAPIPHLRNPQSGWPPLYKHVGLYAYRRSTLLALAALDPTPLERAESLEQLRALEHGIRIKAVETSYDSISVDTPDDLERVRRLIAAGVTRTRHSASEGDCASAGGAEHVHDKHK
jgi:3-deoxy-manno-octulosonate cytidylyltransferase (CMP-KDO synthetase)